MIEEIYSLYYDELLKWSYSKTNDKELSEDIIQETFLRAMKKIEILKDLNKSQCRSYLYRTAKNLYVDKIRNLSHEIIKENICEEEKVEANFDDFYNEDILSNLCDEEKMLFVMRYLQGYNSTELGKIFGLSPATIRSKLSSARKNLRKKWEE